MSYSPLFKRNYDIPFWIINIALLAGIVLSILSWMELCVEHCSANQEFRLFGLPFSIVGMIFFSGIFVLQIIGFKTLASWGIVCALGAELMFIGVQKFQIGHWCPVCLSIALTVTVAALAACWRYIKKQRESGESMHMIKTGLKQIPLFFLGFFLAFVGISKANSAQAAAEMMKERIAFGNRNSQVEVYIISDWFCPSCKKIEPLIEKMVADIYSKAAIYFIDYPIHTKSSNFSPYHLAFLIYNKPQYFQARVMLTALAENNDSPTDQDVVTAARKVNLTFNELSYLDVKSGIEYFDGIVKKYDLSATPTIIVRNIKTDKNVKFEGRDEISEEKILKALETLGTKSN